MTARQLWEALLTELNKVNAPAILLQDFNYWVNVATYKYANRIYNIYDTTQQTTDDLRVLKSTVKIPITNINNNTDKLYSKGNYQVDLPSDYYHLLNCICEFNVTQPVNKCKELDEYVHYKASRLTADMWGEVMNNYYMKPTYKRPYYYFNNIHTGENKEFPNDNSINIQNSPIPNNPESEGRGTDLLSDIFKVAEGEYTSLVDKKPKLRYGNASNVRMEIRTGYTKGVSLVAVYIDYLRVPQNILLTQEQLDLVIDTSQILEFPDYVCLEIVNELVKIVMENASDPRLQTHIPVSQSIVPPIHGQTK